MHPTHNWSGNLTYTAERVHQPSTVGELTKLIRGSRHVRILGTRHCFNAIADTPGQLISLEKFNRILGIDATAKTVDIEAGVRYGELGTYLHERGYALPNLASLPHISVAGACATATHGSGIGNGNLATSVRAMEFITGTGSRTVVSRESEPKGFDGTVVHLGTLGAITKLSLDIVPTFDVRQYVFENLPTSELESNFEIIAAAGYSVSLFTNWTPGRINQVWIKRLADQREPRETFFGATAAPADRHPIDGVPAVNCTSQMGVPGPWHERLPHFKLEFTPSNGEELQSEYFVAREHAVPAFKAIAELHEPITPLLFISEIRTIAADRLWMSPHFERDSVAFHFTWKPDWPNVQKVLPLIESALAPFDPRPHWGKLFTMPAEMLRRAYPRFIDFQKVQRQLDPEGKFINPFLREHLFA